MNEPTYLEIANALLIRAFVALEAKDAWHERTKELLRDIEIFMSDDTK